MTTQTDTTPEVKLARRALSYAGAAIKKSGGRYERRDELLVYRNRKPDRIDSVFRVWPDADDDKVFQHTAFEIKVFCDSDLVRQVKRLVGMADEIWAVVPRCTESFKDVLFSAGAYGVLVMPDKGDPRVYTQHITYANLDTTLIAEAFDRQPEKWPVEAGQAAVKRASPKRTRWWPLAEYVREHVGPEGADLGPDCERTRR